MMLLEAIASSPHDGSLWRAGTPLNLCERIRMCVLKARICILSVSEERELARLVERDRAEEKQR